MSRRYLVVAGDGAGAALILKWTVSPRLTLMSVAKPWMLASPAPLISHTLGGATPTVLQFSATMAFAGARQGSAGADAPRAARPTALRAAVRLAVCWGRAALRL